MKNKFSRKKKLNEDVSLQITSMADIFIIILVFLLKSSATSVSNLSPTGQMSLPLGTSDGVIKDSVKLEVMADTVLVDAKPVVALKDFEFIDRPDSENAASQEILQALTAQRGLLPVANLDSSLLVLADEKMPYATFQRILSSAASAGFVDLQLVVVQPE